MLKRRLQTQEFKGKWKIYSIGWIMSPNAEYSTTYHTLF